ncbi:roadblock/LC7 domain-containing protein [Streptomyces sp. NPDC002004]
MQDDGSHTTTDAATGARAQLSGLLTSLIDRIPGAQQAVLGTGDGFKLAHSEQPVDDADRIAAGIAGHFSLARHQFQDASGGVRQVVVEHDAGTLFVMSTGVVNQAVLGMVLAVKTTPEADPGQVGHQMAVLIKSLDEHLVVQARRNPFHGQGQ